MTAPAAMPPEFGLVDDRARQDRQLADLKCLMQFVLRTRARNCLGIVRSDWRHIVDAAAELGVRL